MNTTTSTLLTLFERDLNKLEAEIRQYPGEVSLWKLASGIKNTGGNLCLHLCGNLQHYLGKVLSGTTYQRNRDLEFSAKDVPVSEILKEIDNARKTVKMTLENLDDAALETPYPENVFSHPMTIGYFMIHLYGHLNYHLGQINYHRRLVGN